MKGVWSDWPGAFVPSLPALNHACNTTHLEVGQIVRPSHAEVLGRVLERDLHLCTWREPPVTKWKCLGGASC